MVLAWYLDAQNIIDRQLENHRNPREFVSMEDLFNLSGVELFRVNVDDMKNDDTLSYIRKERGYVFESPLICSKDFLKDMFEEKLNKFYTEHLHEEEILLVVEGSGYFDIRDLDDQWIRISAGPGDMIIFPSGIYHRFTLDKKNYLKAVSFSTCKPVLTAHHRPADNTECRKNYLDQMQSMIKERSSLCMT